jgi:hypothetical protein
MFLRQPGYPASMRDPWLCVPRLPGVYPFGNSYKAFSVYNGKMNEKQVIQITESRLFLDTELLWTSFGDGKPADGRA